MVNPKTNKICIAFCNPINNNNGTFKIEDKLSTFEIEQRLKWESESFNKYITSIGSGNRFLKVIHLKNKKLVYLKNEGKGIVNNKINTFHEELNHYISHFNEIQNNSNNKNSTIIKNNNCICYSLIPLIQYFPYYYNITHSIACYVHLRNSLKETVYLKDIVDFLNNSKLFSNNNINYFNYLINCCCNGLKKFLTLPKNKALFEIDEKDEVTLTNNNTSINHTNTNSSEDDFNITLKQIQIEIFYFMLHKKKKYNEITVEEVTNIIKKYDIKGKNTKEIINKVLNLESNYFSKNKNKYIVNMEKSVVFSNDNGGNTKYVTKAKKYSFGKSFVSQCVWLHPYYEKCIIIILDYLKMRKIVNSKDITVESVYEWLIQHYSWNKNEKKEVIKLIERCKGFSKFLSSDINSKLFQINTKNGNEYVSLQKENCININNLKMMYKKYQLKEDFEILSGSNSNKEDGGVCKYNLMYSYLTFINIPSLNKSHELKIFTLFYITCTTKILPEIYCNIHNLLAQIDKYNIPIKEPKLDYLKTAISNEKQLTTQTVKLLNYPNDTVELTLFNFSASEKNKNSTNSLNDYDDKDKIKSIKKNSSDELKNNNKNIITGNDSDDKSKNNDKNKGNNDINDDNSTDNEVKENNNGSKINNSNENIKVKNKNSRINISNNTDYSKKNKTIENQGLSKNSSDSDISSSISYTSSSNSSYISSSNSYASKSSSSSSSYDKSSNKIRNNSHKKQNKTSRSISSSSDSEKSCSTDYSSSSSAKISSNIVNTKEYKDSKLDIILDTMINITIICSINILNVEIVSLDLVMDCMNKFVELFPKDLYIKGMLSFYEYVDNEYVINYVKKENKKIHSLIKIDNEDYIGFSNINQKEIPYTNDSIQKLYTTLNKNKLYKKIKFLVRAIKRPDLLKKSKTFISINNYVQYFPFYKNLIKLFLEELIENDEINTQFLRNIDQCDEEITKRYYQFLLRACNGMTNFITECPVHKSNFLLEQEDDKNTIITYINPSELDNSNDEREIMMILKKMDDKSSDTVLLILTLNYIIAYGEYYDDENGTSSNSNKYICVKKLEKYLSSFKKIKNMKLFVSNHKDYICYIPKNETTYQKDIITFNMESNKIFIKKNKSLKLMSSKSILEDLSRYLNLVFIKNKYKFASTNHLGSYIKLYPLMDKFEGMVMDHLLNYGFYDHEKSILKGVEQKASTEEWKIFKYYMVCCNGFENIMSTIKNIEIHKFHKITFYKCLNSNNKEGEKSNTTMEDEKKETKVNNLNNDINNVIKNLLPSYQDHRNLENLKAKISSIILKKWPGLSIHLFGSSTNGLWSRKSDVDMCIFAIEKGDFIHMKKLANILRIEKMENVIPIENTRIPICKFRDPSTGLNCDISVNNRIATYNSELIRCYMDLDERVRDIIMIVKKWAKHRGINNSKNHTFSSYSFVLLCISFFQRINPPLLPNLQNANQFPFMTMTRKSVEVSNKLLSIRNKKCGDNGKIRINLQYYNNASRISKSFKSKNMMNRSELLLKFFEFYSQEYDYKKMVSSIRTDGGFLSENNFNTRFAIEDPFIHGRNTTSNSRTEDKEHIINEFSRAYYILKRPNSSLHDIFKNDEIVNENI
eukprot:jgi/Orpsp1_1/1184467/evm.model.c7180000089656.1